MENSSKMSWESFSMIFGDIFKTKGAECVKDNGEKKLNRNVKEPGRNELVKFDEQNPVENKADEQLLNFKIKEEVKYLHMLLQLKILCKILSFL